MHVDSWLLELLQESGKDTRNIQGETTFQMLKMDSYEILDFLLKVEDLRNVTFPDEEISMMQTMNDVLEAVNKYSREE